MDNPASTIGLIDYGAGNLLSVQNALRACGADPRIVRGADDLCGVTRLILPGVGSFGDCVENLMRQGLWRPLRDWLGEGRPYLGICLGYQVLFEGSEESPLQDGLGVFAGRVRRFSADAGLKVPHMGWNTVAASGKAGLWHRMPETPYFYFVHSYYPEPADAGIVAGTTCYGSTFASAVSCGSVHGVQFHPERSQANGLALLRQFLETS